MVALIFIIAIVVYIYYIWDTFTYWRRRGVPGPTPLPFVGNFGPVVLGIMSDADLLQKIYQDYPNEKYVGIYRGSKPVLLARDPEIVKNVLVDDLQTFMDKALFVAAGAFNKSLLGINDYYIWKLLRKAFSPTLTRHKVSKVLPSTKRPVKSYIEYLDKTISDQPQQDMTQLQQMFMLEVVGAMTLGKELGCLQSDSTIFKQITKTTKTFFVQKSMHKLAVIFPWILKLVMPIMEFFVQSVYRFYYNFIIPFIDAAIESKSDNSTQTESNSFLDFLTDILGAKYSMKNGEDNISELVIDNDVIIQQCIITWIANYVNTLNGTSLALYEIALRSDVQKKVHEEIDRVYETHNGEITLEAVNELIYLQMVLDEVLRKHASNGVIGRHSVRRYTFPGTDLTIDKGTLVLIPIQALHHDPKYYPDPLELHPERFSIENQTKIHSCAYLAFGRGQRDCIGQRFAKVVLLMAVSIFLRHYEVSPVASRMLHRKPYRLGVQVPGGVWLNIKKRTL